MIKNDLFLCLESISEVNRPDPAVTLIIGIFSGVGGGGGANGRNPSPLWDEKIRNYTYLNKKMWESK